MDPAIINWDIPEGSESDHICENEGGYLQKKSGTGTLPFVEIQILDEEISIEQMMSDLAEWLALNYQANINREENFVLWNIADTEIKQKTATVINDFFEDNPKYK